MAGIIGKNGEVESFSPPTLKASSEAAGYGPILLRAYCPNCSADITTASRIGNFGSCANCDAWVEVVLKRQRMFNCCA